MFEIFGKMIKGIFVSALAMLIIIIVIIGSIFNEDAELAADNSFAFNVEWFDITGSIHKNNISLTFNFDDGVTVSNIKGKIAGNTFSASRTDDGSITEMDVPENGNGVKRNNLSYMWYKMVSDKTSKQYGILYDEKAYDNGPFRMYDDKYCVALGSYYGQVGDEFQITFTTPNGGTRTVNCIMGDIKQDRHTLNGEGKVALNGGIVEFVASENNYDITNRKIKQYFTEVVAIRKVDGYNVDITGKIDGGKFTIEGEMNGIPLAGEGEKSGNSLNGYGYWGEGALALLGEWQSPFKDQTFVITSAYGWRIHPIYGTEKYHEGWDLCQGNPSGPIYASRSGTVTIASVYGGYGNCVVIDHGGGVQTLYGHLSKIDVEVGDEVEMGEQVGLEGSTGNSTGPHLHWEFRVNGVAVDAEEYAPNVIKMANNYSAWANTKVDREE